MLWYGVVLRSAWGPYSAMTVYLQRGKEYRDMTKEPSLHGERFLKAYLDHRQIVVHEVSSYRYITCHDVLMYCQGAIC